MSPRGSGGWLASGGFTAVDAVLALAITITMTALAMPLAAHTLDVTRCRHAAGVLAAEFRAARQTAAATRRTTAVVFENVGNGWGFRVCTDLNANGVRRTEIAAGVDRCDGPATELQTKFRDVSIAVSAAIPGPEGDAPSADPVRFGATNSASCAPAGGCSPGTVFVRSSSGVQFAVRLGGMTGRARVLRYEPGRGQWITE